MVKSQVTVVGRRVELAAVEEYAETGALVLVRGDRGIGKTTLLGEIQRTWRARGITVLRLDYAEEQPRWDEFGAQLVIDTIRNLFHEIGDSRVAAAVAAVSRSNVPETYASAAGRPVLFAELVRLFRCLDGNGPVAVLADDVHAAPHPELAVSAAYQAGCTVVAACHEDGLTAEPTPLSATAGRVLDLTPLPDDEIGELLAAAAPKRLDEAVAPVLQAGLGSLAGNPEVVLGTFEELARDGRFAEVQGQLCLDDPTAPIALPAGHALVRHVVRLGEPAAQLVALAGRMDRFGVGDLPAFAAATERDLGDCGRLVDELVTAGALDHDDDGILSVPCPALVTAVQDECFPQGTASLHRAIAEHLLQDRDVLLPEPAAVADHIALAGAAMPPDPGVVPLLESEAERVLQADPLLAGRWYRAALRHCRPDGPDRDRILSFVLRLLVRVGHYRCVGGVVAEAVPSDVGGNLRYELAVAAALAAVHTGVPVPEPVQAALAADASARGPLEFAARWFDGLATATADDLEPVFGAFRSGRPVGSGEADAFAVEDVPYDIVTLFRQVLGADYGEPSSGPVALFRQLARNYAGGDWRCIPSGARRLELAGAAETALHEAARLLAAEALATQGDYDSATWWLERAGAGRLFPALHTWVAIGVDFRTGAWDRARERGWAAYQAIGRKVTGGRYPGLRSFLVRLARLEWKAGNTGKLQSLCDDAKSWYARYGGENLRITQLMLRGLAEHDYAAATEAVELVRERNDLSELMRALLHVAFIAEEPRPWYHEAYEIARHMDGDWMRLHVKSYMRDNGVSLPSHRSGRTGFTETEERIIDLIRQGLTNRQIAAAVQVSEKTVENHLTRLFAKTGCRSRLDLATASLEGRLTVAAPGNRVS